MSAVLVVAGGRRAGHARCRFRPVGALGCTSALAAPGASTRAPAAPAAAGATLPGDRHPAVLAPGWSAGRRVAGAPCGPRPVGGAPRGTTNRCEFVPPQ